MKTKELEEEISDFEDELRGKNAPKKRKKLKNCFFCDKIFDVRSVEQTIRPKYRCQECFDANIIKKIKYKEVKCNFCGIKYVDTYYTKKGLSETKTKTKKCEDCRNRKIPKGPLPRPKMDYAECDICGMTFRKKILIYNHMDKHRSDVSCRVCGAKFTARSALRGHLRTHFEKFVCELCGFTTNVSAMFRKHNKIHEGKPIPEIVKNRKPTIQEKGQFPCSICGIIFQSKVGLLGHEKRQHSENGVNGFACKICGELSYRIKEYRLHVLTHSSKPLLFCHYPNCNIFYDRLKPLNAHIRNVHKQSNNDYSCSSCGKGFKYKHSVDKHLRNNRCVPLKDRNFMKDVFSKRMKPFIENENNKSAEELERIAKIAKEQYLEVRGLLSVIENEQHSDSEQEDTIKEEIIIEENINDETGLKYEKHDDVLEVDNYQQLDDCLDLSPVIESIEEVDDDVGVVEPIKEPFVKIEIKTEPDTDDMLSPPIVQEDWNYLKNDPDIFNMSSDLPNPYVLLERLDYATIMKWINVKKEYKDIKPDITDRKLIIQKKMLKMRMLAYNRRIKGSSYECDMCEFKSKSKNKLAKHLINHKRVLKTNRHRCEICNDTFSRMVDLYKHKKAIHKIANPEYTTKDYICDLCGKAYGTINLLKNHLRLTHSTTYYSCQYCPMKFKTRIYAERHENDVHLLIRKYACQFCGKCFKRKHGLKNHENRHTSKREICPICGKSVKILKEHIKFSHETKKDKELIPCNQCGRGFTKYNMQFHIERFHLKVINERTQIRHCLKCDQSFPRVDDLRRHDILEHFEGVIKRCPYDFCDAIFKKTKPLNVHIKTVHIRNDIHTCEICKKTFDTRSGLLKHAKVKGHKIPEKTL